MKQSNSSMSNLTNSPTKGSLLELLATVQRVSKFEQTAVILSNRDDQVSTSVELSKSQLVVVLIVQDIEERRQEGVEILSKGAR